MIKFAILLGAVLTSFSSSASTPQELWQAWPEARFEATAAPCLRHAQLMSSLQALKSRHPDSIRLEQVGQSFLGRPIQLLTVGDGQKKILLWSQMHGDEPSATPALLDIANYLAEHAEEPLARSILQEFTLLMVPMLNPDGVEVYQRRNAQGIDINRDALSLATPEGRLLKRVRDEHNPMIGFNLHDQDRRTAVGNTGQVANIAVLCVSGDDLASYDPQVYEDLPRNQENSWSDVLVRGGHILQPGSDQAFRADLAFDRQQSDRQVGGCSDDSHVPSEIFLVGDASSHGAGSTIDASGSLLLAPFDVGIKGWAQRAWLDHENLSRLARLGVGTLYWSVGEGHRQSALTVAGQTVGQGIPGIEVLTNPDHFPEVVLDGPPSMPDISALLDVTLQTLEVESADQEGVLAKMWIKKSGENMELPPLRKHQSASFLIIAPVSNGEIDFEASRLESVWLDGSQVVLNPTGSYQTKMDSGSSPE